MREGFLQPISNQEVTPRSSRTKRIEELRALVELFEQEQIKHDETTYTIAPIPDNLVRDEFANSAIQLRAMMETNAIYEKAEELLDCSLTPEEEEIVHTTLDYVFKRIISEEVRKSIQKNPYRSSQFYFNEMHTGLRNVLSSGRDIVVEHDLIHITLALKQGLLNENSPIPTFMHDESDFNSGELAMLEEAFASLFTTAILGGDGNYDKYVKNPRRMHEEAVRLLDETTTPLFRGMLLGEHPNFTNPVLGNEAIDTIRLFMDGCRGTLDEDNLVASLALFSQVAAFIEGTSSVAFSSLDEDGRLQFIKDHIQMAQNNIVALVTGDIAPNANEKYAKTVAITRDTCAESVRRVIESPNKPVFALILLDTLKPLYAKAKMQADTTYDRLVKKSEGDHA